MNSLERFVSACRKQSPDRTPAWVMRQAGRYLPEYREIRKGHDFLEMVHTPELACEVTCQPLRRFDMDAAVIFSDILVPCEAMGQRVEFVEGVGPVLHDPIRSEAGVAALSDFSAREATGFLAAAIERVRAEIGPDKAIIGFCGAPFTMASYMIEGGSSRNFEHTKALLYGDTPLFYALAEKLVTNLIPYLVMQAEAGANALQIFDSWGGALDAATYRERLLPHVARLVRETRAAVGREVPIILYLNGGAHLLEVLADADPDVIGLDWRVDPADAIERVGDRVALQGNLDPCTLFAPPAVVGRETARVLDAFADQEGHVFNLGSGILPKTPVASMEALFAEVHSRLPG